MASRTHRDERERPAIQPRTALVTGLALLIAVCLGCSLLLLARPPGAGSRPMGYVVRACVGVNTIPRPQLGVTWISPFMSTLPPVLLQNPACATVPWLPFLPPRGGFAFP